MYKKDFPIFQNQLIYLDSAASAQKPHMVLDGMMNFYRYEYSNVHRGTCSLANMATKNYENARQIVADFIGAKSNEIVFTKGATEAINLVASSYSKTLKPGDEVLVCIAEHHANFVPWQQACLQSGALFKTFTMTPDGLWDLDDFQKQITSHTKVVAISGMSNVLGVINPVKSLVEIAHKVGAKVMLDTAQSICHIGVNVTELDCDYLVFSGHKLYGPTGIGVLYGKLSELEKLLPYQFGGDMIDTVHIQKTTFAPVPARLEAGTPPIAEAIGLGYAIQYINSIGWNKIQDHENKVFAHLIQQLKLIPDIEFLGNPDLKKGLVAFNIRGIHPNDLSMILAKQNVCVRVGHHCAMPIHDYYDVSASIRVSLGLYNDIDDVDQFILALNKSIGFFK